MFRNIRKALKSPFSICQQLYCISQISDQEPFHTLVFPSELDNILDVNAYLCLIHLQKPAYFCSVFLGIL